MTESIVPLIFEILKMIVQGVFTLASIYIAVFLALRRTHSEKIWEAKMRRYADLIEALHNMKRDLDINLDSVIAGRDPETDVQKEWNLKHRAAWDEIRKDIDIGEFLFSPESVRILLDFRAECDERKDDYLSYLEGTLFAVSNCLLAIKAAAKRDLKHYSSWLSFFRRGDEE